MKNTIMKMLIFIAVYVTGEALTKAYVFEKHWFFCGTLVCSAYMLADTMIMKYEIRQIKKRVRKPTSEEIENLLKQVKEDFEKEWNSRHLKSDGDQ